MIVSHRHKFIFLKTGKTAGTSVEIFLSRLLGPDDIATPIKPEDERLRAPHGPRNFLRDGGRLGWKHLAARIPAVASRGWIPLDHDVDYYNHIRAARVKQYLGDEIWNSYYKFTFDRNPWDKQVSYYYWATRDETARHDFKTFTMVDNRRVRGWPIYTIANDVVVDFVGRYETLASDLARALAEVGIREPVDLPHAKSATRPDRDYRSHYDDESRAFIADRSAEEIRLLGYEF